MIIIVDCFKLIKGKGKSLGIYNYARDIIRILEAGKSCSNDNTIKDVQIVVICNKYNIDDFNIPGIELYVEERFNPLNKLHCLWWELFATAQRGRQLHADRVLYPRGFVPIFGNGRSIVVINDLIPFFYAENYPGYFNRFENMYIMLRLKSSAKKSRMIIAISRATEKDIVCRFHIDTNKIRVIYDGVMITNAKRIKTERNPYIIAMTSHLPHKNARGIVESYCEYCKISKNPIDLVIIGICTVDEYDIPIWIKNKIVCYKYIESNDDMYNIIANGTVFLFLSLIEGFGFPPVEAMQLRVPVICSNIAALAEVAGTAAILVNPLDKVEIAKRLDLLINDKNKQNQLIANGIENLVRFNWESRARDYWKAIIES